MTERVFDVHTATVERRPSAERALEVERATGRETVAAELERMAEEFESLDNAAARRGEVDALEIDGLLKAASRLHERADEIRRGDG